MRISDWSSDVCSSDLAYEAIAADAIARFQRQAGRDVRFQTGTDEHGLKMVQTARDRGVPVRALADEMSGYFQDMAANLNLSHDRFIRTARKSVVWGKRGYVRVDIGGRRIINKKHKK